MPKGVYPHTHIKPRAYRPCDRCGLPVRADRPHFAGLCRDCKAVDPLCFTREQEPA